MKTRSKVVVLDGDPGIGRMLGIVLRGEGYRVKWCRTGAEGLMLCAGWRPSVLILELDLPDGPGLSVLKDLRYWSEAPVLILSERKSSADKVAALDAGANDYLVKPFDSAELAARLRVFLRQAGAVNDSPFVAVGPLRIEMETHKVVVDGLSLKLPAIEDVILNILARHIGQVVPWRRLARTIWGEAGPTNIRTLRVHVSSLRRKLESKGAYDLINGRSSVGYSLSATPSAIAPSEIGKWHDTTL
jgi:two-component system KDP operon response regulator KdpE